MSGSLSNPHSLQLPEWPSSAHFWSGPPEWPYLEYSQGGCVCYLSLGITFPSTSKSPSESGCYGARFGTEIKISSRTYVCAYVSVGSFKQAFKLFSSVGGPQWIVSHITLVAVVTDPSVIRLIFGVGCMDVRSLFFFFWSLNYPLPPISLLFSFSARIAANTVMIGRVFSSVGKHDEFSLSHSCSIAFFFFNIVAPVELLRQCNFFCSLYMAHAYAWLTQIWWFFRKIIKSRTDHALL